MAAQRHAPPLVAHCFACVHEDAAAVRKVAHERLAGYARTRFYQEMFAQAGYPEARQGTMSEAMLDAVVVHGDEAAVAAGLRAYLDAGMDELCVSTLVAGADRRAGLDRTLRLLATL
jgi:alkanesulfonate monooxygenase SsuD/methylene tetrahydromethanopterin reductase-like flavin-dependent oxidoreductase (luciferase family)